MAVSLGQLVGRHTKRLRLCSRSARASRGGSAAASAPAHSALHFGRPGSAGSDAEGLGGVRAGRTAGVSLASAGTPFAMQHPLAQPSGAKHPGPGIFSAYAEG